MCPLCEGEECVRFFESRDRIHGIPGVFTVFQCQRCHAAFYHPRLQAGELSRYYPDTYGRYRYSKAIHKKKYRGIRRFVLENCYGYPPAEKRTPSLIHRGTAFLFSFVMVKDVIPYHGAGNILDVGCGGGSYLYRLKSWGWNAYGVEPSVVGAAQARSLGLNVYQGQIREAGFQDGLFDVVRLSHVLEHLTDPRGTFFEIKRILKPDGVVYVTVPNTRSLNFWLFGENWYGLDVPRHVISYCPRALRFLCDATGFKIVKIAFRSGPFNFVRSIKYYLDEAGDHWPYWLRRINWPSSKLIRRTLKPIFVLVDALCLGDVIHVNLRRTPHREDKI